MYVVSCLNLKLKGEEMIKVFVWTIVALLIVTVGASYIIVSNMGNTAMLMYLFVKLDDFIELLDMDEFWLVLTVGGMLMGAGLAIADNEASEDTKNKVFKWIKSAAFYYLIIGGTAYIWANTVKTILPSTKQIAVIYLGTAVAESDALGEMAKLPKKYANILNKKADEYLNEYIDTNLKKEKETDK
jgi:glucan phosphoethanolaminetransferase (alkaline phosphatase superfamily)